MVRSLAVSLAVAVLLALAGCAPADDVLSPSFAGWWGPVEAPLGCERAAMRFARNAIHVRRDGRIIRIFDIEAARLDRDEARLTLRVADEAAIMASIEQRRSARTLGLPSRVVMLSLRRAGDRVIPGNLLIHEDGPRGLRAPRRGEGQALTQIFTMKPCQA